MSQALSPFIRVGGKDSNPATPRLFLQVKGRPQLSLTLPYRIEFTLRRAKTDCSDRPCIIRWSPTIDGFASAGLILLREDNTATGGFEPCAVDQSGLSEPSDQDAIVVDHHGRDKFLWELAPGGEVRFAACLPARYYAAMVPDETYTLLYTGGEVALWDFGTIQEHHGQLMKARSPSLRIPGGARISFTARTEKTQWPGRAAYEAENGFDMANLAEQRWRQQEARKGMRIQEGLAEPIGPDERVPGAPVLYLTLECAPTVTRNKDFAVTVKVTYNGEVCGSEGGNASLTTTTTARPITFRSWAIVGLNGPREGFRLYRQRRSGNDDDSDSDLYRVWEACDLHEDGEQGFNIYDGPDVPVRVAEHKHFTTLRPGESWTTSISLQAQAWSRLPRDMVPGDIFLHGFMGAVVDWWDWGGAEDHADTVVMLPSWTAGRVVDPGDNEGRPKLVVPYAEPVEFKVVE